MGRGKQAGSPLYFRCAKCRRDSWAQSARQLRKGRINRVQLTGEVRPYASPQGSALGARGKTLSREYVCDDCGHRGWSNHQDLSIKAFCEGKR